MSRLLTSVSFQFLGADANVINERIIVAKNVAQGGVRQMRPNVPENIIKEERLVALAHLMIVRGKKEALEQAKGSVKIRVDGLNVEIKIMHHWVGRGWEKIPIWLESITKLVLLFTSVEVPFVNNELIS